MMYSYGPPHMAKQKQDDQLKHTYSSYVRIRDLTLKTSQKRWMIWRSGERGSVISVLAARHDDDDDDDISDFWNGPRGTMVKAMDSLSASSYSSSLLHSLSGKYPWEKYESPYPPSYGLNSTTTVLLGEWSWY